MKKIICFTVLVCLIFSLGGCTQKPKDDVVEPVIVTEIELIEKMAMLDYENMTVNAFNAEIEKMCEEAKTDIFTLMSIGSQEIDTQNKLYPFFTTVLMSTNIELLGDPFKSGSAVKMRTVEQSDKGIAKMRETMTATEWADFTDENAGNMEFLAVMSFSINYKIQDGDTLTVNEREKTLTEVVQSVQAYMDELNEEDLTGLEIAELFKIKLEEVSKQYSNQLITINCEYQQLEVNGEIY